MTKIPARRDQPPSRDYFCSNMALHLHTYVPPVKDHLSYKTTGLRSHWMVSPDRFHWARLPLNYTCDHMLWPTIYHDNCSMVAWRWSVIAIGWCLFSVGEQDLVQDVIVAADLLQMDTLKRLCANHMQTFIDDTNCIGKCYQQLDPTLQSHMTQATVLLLMVTPGYIYWAGDQ